MASVLNLRKTCCLALSSLLGNKVSYPLSTSYNSSLGSYFSAQAASLHPSCIVEPKTVDDVSIALATLSSAPCRVNGSPGQACEFSVRSGGHNSNVGAANIENGVSIDLSRLNMVELSLDHSQVHIGAGSTWDTVYSKLDQYNLCITGGRSAGVGVGGLSLGGGVSFYGTRYGWTSDAVDNFQIVLANGSVVNANQKINPDLAWALRGGTSNFGIVTRVDMPTFEQGPFWGGYFYQPLSVWPEAARQFVSINTADSYDPYVHMTFSLGYQPGLGSAIGYGLDYTKAGVENPPVFSGILRLPVLFGSAVISNMTQKSFEVRAQQTPDGFRYDWSTITLVSTEEALNAAYGCFNDSVEAIQNVSNLTWSLTFEPLPPLLYSRHANANALGLGNRSQALVIVLLEASWPSAVDDDRVVKEARKLMSAIKKTAQTIGVWDPFVYLNYAGSWQNPISSYGEENVRRLRHIARRVDPHQVFTNQVPGGFKIQ